MYNPAQDYPSQRSPVAAENMVATSQPLAAQAGLETLRAGGNAVDAALASAITLTIVEPTGNGIGADAFALVWHEGELYGLNASGRAPAGWSAERFSRYTEMPMFGWDAVTVPGAVSAWVELSQKFGRLPFADLFRAAIGYAEHGFGVGPITAKLWQNVEADCASQPGFAEHFLPAPAAGERFKRPDAGRSLQAIAESGGEAFYRGSLAEQIAAAAEADAAALSLDDLNRHQADWVAPINIDYRGATMHQIPPNGQGLAVLVALGILENLEVGKTFSARSCHYQMEAMKVALKAAADHIADEGSMRVSVGELLSQSSLKTIAQQIGDKTSDLPPASLPASPDTVYLATADSDGQMVSFIQSNFYRFGSGVVVPHTGIAMHNRGWGFSLIPGHPNEVGPRKRPFHTIIPGFITRNGEALASFGVMGGPMQAQGHVQMAVRLLDYGENPQAASDAPRWQVMKDNSILLEPGFPEAFAEDLRQRGHRIKYDKSSEWFGGAQLIVKSGDLYIGGSDHRKEGMAAGF
ncbi:MAG: gamma-glutamyltransferase family protein [Gammaproteobacteria bacterium]